MFSRRFALGFTVLALVAAIVVVVRPRTVRASFSPRHPLATLAPLPPPGWEVRDTPLGTTELEAGESARILNFSDYFFKTYSNGEMQVRVYVAYWVPGRMDPALVWLHRPDTCWVENGATEVGSNKLRVLPAAGGRRLWPALYEVFDFPMGEREEAVFWHCYGGRPSGFAVDPDNPLWNYRAFIRSFRLSLAPREQIFVRISTNRTIDELVKSDLWPKLAEALLPSGIYQPAG